MTRRLVYQIVREFWIQTVFAILWATYRSWHVTGEIIPVFIANFGGAFFLTSWAFGQYMRIRKQQQVEDEFQNVKSGLQRLLDSLEQQTRYLIGHTTGGDSIGYFKPAVYAGSTIVVFPFFNVSEYPVFDVFAEWIDIDEPIDPPRGKLWTRNKIAIGTIHSKKVALNVFGIDMAQREHFRINVFIQTRNRNIQQQIRIEKVNGQIKIAVKTDSENFSETNIPSDFPNYDQTQRDKVFS
jgi:hypothetical protein